MTSNHHSSVPLSAKLCVLAQAWVLSERLLAQPGGLKGI
jgi:hypothetical protein